ncbi:MAG: hypothetical protein DMG60_16285 [Acidobacteria bacterium]|nr:MAG: hypothetical protein DMG60_16285 [Acidobacteriota bacterium]
MDRSLDDEGLRADRGPRESESRVSQESRHSCPSEKSRTAYELRGREYHLNSPQSALLRDVGTFRTITAESLQKHLYHDDKERFRKDLRNLADQRLIEIHADSAGKSRYISLTRTGKAVTEEHLRTNQAQAVYSGIVKKRELRHDAAIYELYHKEAKHIAKTGGTPKRVVLDFELKKNINRQVSKLQDFSPEEYQRRRQEIADAHGLKIVESKIQIPDLRVEYESRKQEQSKVDLECITGHYKARQIAAKTAAGFKLYNQDYRGRSAERGEDLVGEVISL